MSTEIVADDSSNILTIRVTGLLKQPDFAESQKKAGEIIRRKGKVRLLVLMEDFLGVDKTGDWGDVSFQTEFDRFIEKIALVGDKKWEAVALLFTGKGVRRVSIEYFQPADLAKAKAWLSD